jgi:hypothetical protein
MKGSDQFFLLMCVVAVFTFVTVGSCVKRDEGEYRKACAERGGKAVMTRGERMCVDPKLLK